MFVFGHLGIGSKLASPWSRGLRYRMVLLGTILPDLIDKPIYYGLSLATGKVSGELGLLSCTRTFAHTVVFLLALTAAASFRRSKALAAIAIGVATHLLLDNLSDRFTMSPEDVSSAFMALVFPAMGFRFALQPFEGLGEHLGSVVLKPFTLLAEALGIALLAWDAWKRRHLSEIVKDLRVTFRRMRRASKEPWPHGDHF